jgi:hypothetical protein
VKKRTKSDYSFPDSFIKLQIVDQDTLAMDAKVEPENPRVTEYVIAVAESRLAVAEQTHQLHPNHGHQVVFYPEIPTAL